MRQHGHARVIVVAAQGFLLEKAALLVAQQLARQVVRPALLVVGQRLGRGVPLQDVLVGV